MYQARGAWFSFQAVPISLLVCRSSPAWLSRGQRADCAAANPTPLIGYIVALIK